MSWVEHVACKVEKRERCKLLEIRPEQKRLIKKLISMRIILKRIFRRMGERVGLIWLIIRTSGSLLWTW
jgi:DNA-binding MarR family transcriptional regulator